MIKNILGVFLRLWDWFFSTKRVEQRRKDEVDKALAEHDSAKINELLDKNL